jgi:hypothetical protein
MRVYVFGGLQERWVEDFLFDLRVDLERSADLSCQRFLARVAASLFELFKPSLDLTMVGF